MMMMMFLWPCLVLVLGSVVRVRGIVDYCADNTFASNSTWLQFTKELSTREYAINAKFKSLHCCTKGYRSIEWYKDGRPYPWPGGLSNLILYPESANQTIYSQTVAPTDAGNYSCLVRNDTHTHWHTINLTVIDAVGYSGSPLPTYEPEDQYVELGDEARLFCEAFVGHIDLPDAHNEVSWRQVESNATLHRQKRYQQRDVPREDSQILGSYLLISEVRHEDLGDYFCRISNTWFQAIEMPVRLRQVVPYREVTPQQTAYKKLLLVVSLVVLSLLTILALYIRFGLQLRVIWKDTFSPPESNDGKEYDVLVCYDEKDSEFVLGIVVPTLETRYDYRCCSHHLVASSQGRTWPAELNGSAQRSRRLLAVLSPSLLQDNWTSAALYQVLQTLLRIHSRVICIKLQTLPKADPLKNERGESLPQLLRAVQVVQWSGEGDRGRARRRFWSSLRLRLPPQRRRYSGSPCAGKQQEMSQISVTSNSAGTKRRTLLANSHESLEVLV